MAVERLQPAGKELAGLLRMQPMPDATAALVVANGTTIGARPISSMLETFTSVIVVADTKTRAEEARSAIGAGEILSAGTPLHLDLPLPVGFCAILAGAGQMREVFEELLYDELPGALADGAIVAVQFCRDASEGISTGLQLISSRALDSVRDFLRSQFDTTKIDDESALASRFANDVHYEYLAWCPRGTAEVAADPFVWLLLRKRPGAGNRPATSSQTVQAPISAFPRTPSATQFLLSDFDAIVSGMKQANIELVHAKRFANRLAKFAAQSRDQKFKHSFGLLKFDIHGNIRRPLEMAKILSRHSASGLFLMMPRHPLNEHFYDQPSTWQILREIESLGHEVGIHIDPFHLIATRQNLYTGLDAALQDFRSRGIEVRSATLHGDSRSHIKERKLQANDFFHDGVRKSKWDGKIPKGEAQLAPHIRAYSLLKLAEEFGLSYFPEVNFLRNGKRLTHRPITYLSDNQHAFALRTGSGERHSLSAPYRLDSEFLNELLSSLARQPFLALFHPQWYR
jgi:hypothetical protein